MLFCRIDEMNRRIEADPVGYIAEAEAGYQNKVERVAQQVRNSCKERPVVLISGPSGSGKTTTAHKLEHVLEGWGMETHTISMDNYFYSWSDGELPQDENGQVDLESPLRLDVPLLQDHLNRLSHGERVEVPTFDFSSQQRKDEVIPYQLAPGDLIILEGIHALNPAVTGSAAEYSTGIYVSVRTRLMGRGGALLHPEKLRLMRRLLRDFIYRGQSYENTIQRLRSVSRGEELYIMPYKDRAKITIDTFLPYEPAVYSAELKDGLEQIASSDAAAAQIADILEFLNQITPIETDSVPDHSLLREFVGEAGVLV